MFGKATPTDNTTPADGNVAVPPQATATLDDEAIFDAALQTSSGAWEAALQEEASKTAGQDGFLDGLGKTALSAGIGGAEAVFETYDFVMGEPAEQDKSDFRRTYEMYSKQLERESAIYGATNSVSQFVTGMIGAGKLTAATKVGAVAKAAPKTAEVLKAASVGAVVFDPNEERLSNLVQSVPALQNPVTEFLAASPDDSAAAGRFKSAVESIGLDVALGAAFMAVTKFVKASRAGDEKAAAKAMKEAEDAHVVNVEEETVDAAGANEQGGAAPVTDSGDTTGVSPGDNNLGGGGPIGGNSSGGVSGAPAEQGGRGDVGSGTGPGAVPPRGDELVAKPSIEFTDDEIEAVLDEAALDEAAITKAGSRAAATEAGHKFASVVPWRKIGGTEQFGAFMQRALAAKEVEIAAIKGGDVLTDKKLGDRVMRLARAFGEDPAFVMGTLQRAGKQAGKSVAQMEVGFAISTKLGDEAYSIASKLRLGLWKEAGFASEEEALGQFKKVLGMAGEAAASARSILSNSGRSLRRARFGLDEKALKALQGMDVRRAAEAVAATGGDPKLLQEVIKPTAWQRLMKTYEHLAVNGPLWGWSTHAVNTTTSLLNLGLRPLEKVIGSGVQKAVTPLLPKAWRAAQEGEAEVVRSQALKEYRYSLAAVSDAWRGAVDTFMSGDSKLAPHTMLGANSDVLTQNSLRQLPVELKSVVDLVPWLKAATGVPTRVLGAQDEFFKTIRYRAVVQAKAATEAERRGLSKAETHDFVQRRLDEAYDANGAYLDADAMTEARVSTFTDELENPIARRVQQAVSEVPLLRAVMTYVKTPIKVLGYGLRMTPGLQALHSGFRRDLLGQRGAEAQAQAMGQIAIGHLAAAMGFFMASAGHITGGGPKDPAARRELTKTGWQPYSWRRVKEDGSVQYVPVGRLDPVGMVFGMAADMHDIYANPEAHDGAKELPMALATSIAHNVANRTFMMSLDMAIKAFSEPDKFMDRWLGNAAESALPFSSLMRNNNPDPYLREARGFFDNVMDRMPGFSEKMPPKRDAFGDPIRVYSGLIRGSKLDVVDEEMQRLILINGKGLGVPAAARNKVDLRDIPLTTKDGRETTAYDVLQEYAARPPMKGVKPLKEVVAEIIKDPKYKLLSDNGGSEMKNTKLWKIGGAVSKYREDAFKLLQRDFPEVRQALLAKQEETNNAVRANIDAKRQEGKAAGLEVLGVPLSLPGNN